jgi:hypothetical protein
VESDELRWIASRCSVFPLVTAQPFFSSQQARTVRQFELGKLKQVCGENMKCKVDPNLESPCGRGNGKGHWMLDLGDIERPDLAVGPALSEGLVKSQLCQAPEQDRMMS